MPKEIRPLNEVPELGKDSRIAANARIQHRRAFVLRYVIAGFSTEQIARLYNKSVESYPELQTNERVIMHDRKCVMRELRDRHASNLEEWRGLLLERHELVIRTLTPMVQTGNLGAIDRYLRVLDQIGSLTGANAPVKIDVQHNNLSTEERWERLTELLEVARQRAEAGVIDVGPDERLPELPESTDADIA